MGLYSKIIDLQKLGQAWDKVKKNKPAAGVDQVTYEEFDREKVQQLKDLNQELKDHGYHTLPVKLVNLYKGEKVRKIALYSMRDKVVQQSLARELSGIFDTMFTKQTYAYRANKSALTAIDEIHTAIVEGQNSVFLKIDVSGFFEHIRWERLERILRVYIHEEDVIQLIHENACSTSLNEKSGELEQMHCGIYQGSGIAPILSNIYMMEFDKWLVTLKDIYFIRYSDDLLLLGKDHGRLFSLLQEIVIRLEECGLKIKEEKSHLGEVREGFQFLGYAFDENGKAIPQKAEDNLTERLEMFWLTNHNLSIEEKLRKVMEVVGGWEQYFRGEREIGSIFELAACVYVNSGGTIGNEDIERKRWCFKNPFRDLTLYFAEYWKEKNNAAWQLFEYEQFYSLERSIELENRDSADKYITELNREYVVLLRQESKDAALEIMQLYADLGLYAKAEFWQAKSEEYKRLEGDLRVQLIQSAVGVVEPLVTKYSVENILRLFVGREDVFAKETLDVHGRRKKEIDYRPLTERIVAEHLNGKSTIDTYIQRPNATVRFMVIDIDISKRIILTVNRSSDGFQHYLQKALDYAAEVKKVLAHWGIRACIEYSGNRGYHVWVLFTEWIQTRYANLLWDALEASLKKDEDITIEFFPNKTRVLDGKKMGQVIKLPFGIHIKSGERSYFLDEEGSPVTDIDAMMDSMPRTTLAEVKKVLTLCDKAENTSGLRQVQVQEDLSAYEPLAVSVADVLHKCALLRYLCQKSVKTGYLTHYERLTVLYVFGHLGNDGKQFVHQVMSFTLNYKFQVTDHFINKCPEKPISCVKLREQYKQLTAEIGCSCAFKRKENCYPSPVLHAINSVNGFQEDITLPTARTLTKEKEEKLKEGLNIYVKVQELAKSILDYKKQRRSVDKQIEKVERELSAIFDEQKTDHMEIEMGLLKRKIIDGKTEWVIEL